ncbi:MAG: hypothetical protein K2Y32_20635 [Candidatus Obscuribacterales bacterium]|nr:hypothetical protein [Candidatus Obscuribacterales bacterium]
MNEEVKEEIKEKTEKAEQIKELAEKYIAASRRDELHRCATEYDVCLGCELMRRGLEMLAEAGDETVYIA